MNDDYLSSEVRVSAVDLNQQAVISSKSGRVFRETNSEIAFRNTRFFPFLVYQHDFRKLKYLC